MCHIPRERMTHQKVSVDAQLFSKFSNLVLEHLPEGFNQFQLSIVLVNGTKATRIHHDSLKLE